MPYRVKYLKLQNFRNWKEDEFHFESMMTGITGRNGTGKTTLIDAIYMCCMIKSFQGMNDRDTIRKGEDYYYISTTIIKDNEDHRINLGYTRTPEIKKSLTVNGIEVQRYIDHIGCFPIVSISPDNLSLINVAGAIRRKWLDIGIAQYNRTYMKWLLSYKKYMQRRNVLLKEEKSRESLILLEGYDKFIAPLARNINQERKRFIGEIEGPASTYYELISEGREEMSMSYSSKLNEQSYEEGVAENLEKDLEAGYSHFGIHRDNIMFKLNDLDIRKFGSQGQKKSYLLAVKLAGYEFLTEKANYRPVLLLDDIFEKLDNRRLSHLLKLVSGTEVGQVFLTDTEPKRVKEAFKEPIQVVNLNEKR